jgi:hypothetical protein
MRPSIPAVSILALFAAVAACVTGHAQGTACGVVYEDANANGARDAGERGLPEVLVSNGADVAATDAEGRWQLPAGDDVIFFVVKPAGFAVPTDNYKRPKYYYIHKPAGSPPEAVPGVAPTGPLPASIDFGLVPKAAQPKFTAVVFSDPQARGLTEVDYIARDVVPELIGTDAAFGVTLGDLVADDPGLLGAVSEITGQIGVPWYQVFGNHDNNRKAREDRFCDESFEHFFGPSTYAFDQGAARFIVLRDIVFSADGGRDRFPDDAVRFVKNLLERTPREKLVVLFMHVPFDSLENALDVLAPLSLFPNTFSIAGHAHIQTHQFFGAGDHGWTRLESHHQLVAGAVSGSWWCGERDETGVPHATMNDGTPNGYALLDVDGTACKVRWKCARRPADYQMNIYLPDAVEAKDAAAAQATVNFFMGMPQDVVEMRIGNEGAWQPMIPTVDLDPECLRMYGMNAQRLNGVWGWDMDFPYPTEHLWRAPLGGMPLTPGTHTLHVKARDSFGQTHFGRRVFRVVADGTVK